MSNIQKQHKISPAIAWLTIQKFIIFYCPLDGEHTSFPHVDIFLYYTKLFFSVQNAGSPCFVICKSVHHQYRRYLGLFVYIIHTGNCIGKFRIFIYILLTDQHSYRLFIHLITCLLYFLCLLFFQLLFLLPCLS